MTLHDNSFMSLKQVKKHKRRDQIFKVYYQSNTPLTDRQVAGVLGFPDLNSVRPRITELVEAKILREAGQAKDSLTGRTVRVVTVMSAQAKFPW